MLKDPLNVAQFPDLAACLPGGPSIKVQDDDGFSLTFGATVQDPVPALTISAENVVDAVGCFNPGACPTIPVSNTGAGTSARASAYVTRDHPPVANAPITYGSPSPSTQKSLPSGEIPSSPPRPPLDREWKAPPAGRVSSHAQTPFGGMLGLPGKVPLDEQPTRSLKDWAAALARPHSGDAMRSSGKPLSNNTPATPEDQANAEPQANIASLIMDAFGSAIGSAVLGRASRNVESSASPTQRPPSSVLGITTSARNETRTDTSDNVESESGTRNRSGVEEAETGSPASPESSNGSAGKGSRTEGLAVRNTICKSRVDEYMLGIGILLAIMTEI
ncbi:MAG: hypothetical protein Q9198_010112 [Flavoplaca austrocitrina]